MSASFLHILGAEVSKTAAWVVIALLAFLAASAGKHYIAELLMKIYRFFIQENGLGL